MPKPRRSTAIPILVSLGALALVACSGDVSAGGAATEVTSEEGMPPPTPMTTMRPVPQPPPSQGGAGAAGETPMPPGEPTPPEVPEIPEDPMPSPVMTPEPPEVKPAPGLACEEAIDTRGGPGCLNTLEGLQVKFFPLAAGKRAKHIAMYFHGDTAPGWKNNWAFSSLIEWATKNDVVLAGALSPAFSEDADGPYEVWWKADDAQTDAIARVVTTLVDAYGAPNDRTLYWGTSGGSQFLTGMYLPHAGHLNPGIYVNSCGGTDPWAELNWDFADRAIRDKFAVYLNYGDQDFLAVQSESAFNFFGDKMFTVDRVIHPNKGHCDHDVRDITIEFWSRHMDMPR